jgi:hypothetical protein
MNPTLGPAQAHQILVACYDSRNSSGLGSAFISIRVAHLMSHNPLPIIEENAVRQKDEIARFEQRIARPVMPELDTTRGIAILLVVVLHGFEFFTPSAASDVGAALSCGHQSGMGGRKPFLCVVRISDHGHFAG